MSQVQIYTPQDLKDLTERLDDINVKGKVTGVSQIHRMRGFLGSLLRSEDLGFYLDGNLFCVYRNTGDTDGILRASAWLDQNRNQEVYLGGDYSPKARSFLVNNFYADSNFQTKEI